MAALLRLTNVVTLAVHDHENEGKFENNSLFQTTNKTVKCNNPIYTEGLKSMCTLNRYSLYIWCHVIIGCQRNNYNEYKTVHVQIRIHLLV